MSELEKSPPDDWQYSAHLNRRLETGADFLVSSSLHDGAVCNSAGTELLLCLTGMPGIFTFPDGVEKIANNAFDYCQQLSGIVISEGMESLNSILELQKA